MGGFSLDVGPKVREYRIGRDARPDGELAPATMMKPPGNCLRRIVLELSRDFSETTRAASDGVSRNIGCRRSTDQPSPSSTVGHRHMVEAGSC